ncbi:hypothetical protein HYFRA_00013060 [Hymenoscyphus fraxineus]|uniref:Uncharacterized protein n=1 Tax=Hymenoscyphus fraxineus TaxID=746836 RepID=A0A9N9L303_9HELO|nr:hypothetical protein HYFRA_00013060 [Hymenoscyphus fraxineus]
MNSRKEISSVIKAPQGLAKAAHEYAIARILLSHAQREFTAASKLTPIDLSRSAIIGMNAAVDEQRELYLPLGVRIDERSFIEWLLKASKDFFEPVHELLQEAELEVRQTKEQYDAALFLALDQFLPFASE